MANLNKNASNYLNIGTNYLISGARTTLPLNAGYVNGTSGTAIAIRYQPRVSAAINEVYFFMNSMSGTLANLSVNATIYNEKAGTGTQTGTTVRATSSSFTAPVPGAGFGWLKLTFSTPYTPAIGESLWIILTNTATAPTVDYPNILTTPDTVTGRSNNLVGYSTLNGFNTAGTLQSKMPCIITIGSGYVGSPITQYTGTFYTNNTLKRGIVVTPISNMTFDVWQTSSASTILTGIQVFLAPAGPGTTPLYSYTLGTDTNATTDRAFGSKILNPALQLLAGNTYYVVNTFSNATTMPSGGQIEDYASYSSIFDYLTDGISNCGSVIDNGSGGWTVSNAYIPGITLTPIDFPTAASGGSFIF
jgi:hypothetical protein